MLFRSEVVKHCPLEKVIFTDPLGDRASKAAPYIKSSLTFCTLDYWHDKFHGLLEFAVLSDLQTVVIDTECGFHIGMRKR